MSGHDSGHFRGRLGDSFGMLFREVGPNPRAIVRAEVEARELAAALFLHTDAIGGRDAEVLPAVDGLPWQSETLSQPSLKTAAPKQVGPMFVHPVSMTLPNSYSMVSPNFFVTDGVTPGDNGRMTESFGFGARLRAARIAKNITGQEMARGTGPDGRDATKASVSDWENERHYPRADQVRAICLKLGITADELIFGDMKVSKELLTAASALQLLSDEERRQLFKGMMGAAVPDHEVERRMPVTKQPPGQYEKLHPVDPLTHGTPPSRKRAGRRG